MEFNKKIIIIAGPSAAGKTTFAAELSKRLAIPYFSKDMVKIAINQSIPVENREDSRRLSAAAFDVIAFVTQRMMEVGRSLIIEANFVMHENHNGLKEGETLQALVNQHNYTPLTFILTGDWQVLYKRFVERDALPQRGVANKHWGEHVFEDFAKINAGLAKFNIGGRLVKIDTTDMIAQDFEKYIETAYAFLKGE